VPDPRETNAKIESPASSKGSVSTADRLAAHEGISALADGLLPALIARLGSTQLGELEVREGDWHVRLRRPATAEARDGREPRGDRADRAARAAAGHEGHAHVRGMDGHRSGRPAGAHVDGASATNGTGVPKPEHAPPSQDRAPGVATSPAVGVFQPGPRATAGTRVRTGDTLGVVDVLGVPQEILAPVDGIVRETLVEAGTAVEYSQELVRLEITSSAEAR
jgi:biotin carboxyl carrier protein